ncbi:MAG: ATP-binding cassette domain-containing protein, partial [Gammaproteobacteria bacterium]
LHDIDLNINRESITTIIGPNGAGKTSLLRIVLGLDAPNQGCIYRAPHLRFGYVPQKFHKDPMLPLTVSRCLSLSPQTPSQQQVHNTLNELSAHHLLHHRINTLSGGELQRVLLARALLNEPDVLALDEPMQGVDVRGQAELYQLLARIKKLKQCSILMISHDLHFVMAATDQVVCLNGHICCHGRPESVQQHPEYLRLFGASELESIGIYNHHHDHTHDFAGDIAQHQHPISTQNTTDIQSSKDHKDNA